MPDTYRGWDIYQGRWPEPAWYAIGPNYDASWEGEEDGWVDNGQKADAPTREALIEEIDDWFDCNTSDAEKAAADRAAVLHPIIAVAEIFDRAATKGPENGQ